MHTYKQSRKSPLSVQILDGETLRLTVTPGPVERRRRRRRTFLGPKEESLAQENESIKAAYNYTRLLSVVVRGSSRLRWMLTHCTHLSMLKRWGRDGALSMSIVAPIEKSRRALLCDTKWQIYYCRSILDSYISDKNSLLAMGIGSSSSLIFAYLKNCAKSPCNNLC